MEGSQSLERSVRSGPAPSRRLRPRVVPAPLVLMARTVLFVFLGLGTLYAQTIRPDDLTVLMAADAVHKGSVKTSDMGPGKVGWVESWDSSGSLSWAEPESFWVGHSQDCRDRSPRSSTATGVIST
jgi:hypothetical protein